MCLTVDDVQKSGDEVSRQVLLKAGKLRVAGNAFTIDVELSNSSDDIATAEEDLRKQIKKTFPKAIKKVFGQQSYCLGDVYIEGNNVRLIIYGYAKENVTGGIYGGERWVDRVDEFQHLMRQNIERMSVGRAKLAPVVTDATWVPGKGVLPDDKLVDSNSPAALNEQLRRLRDRRKQLLRRLNVTGVIAGMISAGILALIYAAIHDTNDRSPFILSLILVIIYLGIPVAIVIAASLVDYDILKEDIYRKEASLDLGAVLRKEEERAYKLFQVNAAELKRYYDQALKQRALVFLLGIFCILGGFACIGATLAILNRSSASLGVKITIGVVGAVSGILANFIAVIFLQMFRSIVSSMVNFHNRLVLTHHMYFGNLLLARVSDETLKEQTLSRMALAISSLHEGNGEQNDSDGKQRPMRATGVSHTSNQRRQRARTKHYETPE